MKGSGGWRDGNTGQIPSLHSWWAVLTFSTAGNYSPFRDDPTWFSGSTAGRTMGNTKVGV